MASVCDPLIHRMAESSALSIVSNRRIVFHKATKPSTAGNRALNLKNVGVTKSNNAKSKTDISKKNDINDHILNYLEWKFVKKVGPGLMNLGNTCYLNSVLQCLTYTPALSQYLLNSVPSENSSNSYSGFHALQAMSKHVNNCLRCKPNQVIQPRSIVMHIKRIGKHFRIGRQEDSHEFLRLLLDAMQRKVSSSSTNNIIHCIFGGKLCSRVACANCSYVSDRIEPFLDLSLEVSQGISSVYQALQHFTAVEVLDSTNAWKCGGCKQYTRARKSLTIQESSNVLILHLKRFSIFSGKIGNHIQFPEILHLSDRYTTSGSRINSLKSPKKQKKKLKGNSSNRTESSVKYRLNAVLVHSGYSMNSGHYYAFIRDPTGQWYEMNDDYVRWVSIQTVLKQNAYVLFYSKIVDKPSTSSSKEVSEKEIKQTSSVATSSIYSINNLPKKMNNCIEKPKHHKALSSSTSPNLDSKSTKLCVAKSVLISPNEKESVIASKSVKSGKLLKPRNLLSNSESVSLVEQKNNCGINTSQESTPNPLCDVINVKCSKKTRIENWSINELRKDSNSHYGNSVEQWNAGNHNDNDSLKLKQEKLLRKMKNQENEQKRSRCLDTWDASLDLGRLKKVKIVKEFQKNEGIENKFQLALDNKSTKKLFKKKTKFINRNRSYRKFSKKFDGKRKRTVHKPFRSRNL